MKKFTISEMIAGALLVLFVVMAGLFTGGCEPVESQATNVTMTRRWTAPSGDGIVRVQQLRSYQAKWATDTTALKNNWAAQQDWIGIGSKVPAAPNSPDNFTFTGSYPYGRVWFAIKGVDSSGNVAPISNFWDTTFVDGTLPEKIIDLH